jgi:hypothetical protein
LTSFERHQPVPLTFVSVMLFAAVLGVIAGFVAKGSIRHLADRRFRGLALAVVWAAMVLATMQDWLPGASGIYIASFGVAMLVVVLNVREFPSLVPVGIGLALNAIVVIVNGGMPYTAGALRAAGIDRPDDSIIVASPQRHIQTEADELFPLIDHFPVAAGPIRDILSPGDVAIAFGVGLTMCVSLLPRRRRTAKRSAPIVPIEPTTVRRDRARPTRPRQAVPTRVASTLLRQPSTIRSNPATGWADFADEIDIDTVGDTFWEERNRVAHTDSHWAPHR